MMKHQPAHQHFQALTGHRKYAGILGNTPDAIENMFAGRTVHVFEEVTEIELEDGTLACDFTNGRCCRVSFFSHDEE